MFSQFFINRPIFASVVAIVMVLSGVLAIFVLPVEQYPEIAPPTVQVTAAFPGADAQTVMDTVAAPIEQEVNGVDGMIYMSSISANDGSYTLTVTFEVGTDVDLAAVKVQNRVSVAEPRLPNEVRQQGISTRKRSQSMLMVLAPHSPNGKYDQLFLSNYVSIYMKDELSRVPGVGDVSVFGVKDYSMRIWLNPDRLAARSLTAGDVIAALRTQNVQVAAGEIGGPPVESNAGFQYTIQTKGRLKTVEEFENIILKVGDQQRTLYLKDVARVELGAQSYSSFGKFNGMPAPVLGIFQLPGSNALDVSEGVRAKLEELRKDFPEGIECPVFYDFTRFVAGSIDEVVETLVIAAILVFLTVLVFLQDWRATLIPGAAIPVSIIGTFAVLLAFGFSINMLTLFGLVLAIGIVVDDAIVVVENTARIMEENPGISAKDAARQSMKEITGPVIATTAVLLAVFLPTSVLPGITGQLYRQFGLTLSIATVLSSVNALTLSPALCGLLLRRREGKANFFFRGFDSLLGMGQTSYLWFVRKGVRVALVSVLIFVGILGATGFIFDTVPTGFLPLEDQLYMEALYRTPLLTAEQERTLFLQMNYRLHRAEMMRQKLIAADEVNTSAVAAIDAEIDVANRLRQRIAQANLRLVVSVAKRHISSEPDRGLFELVSDGNVALMRSIDKFDVMRGFKFSTYATWSIKRAYAKALPQEQTQRKRYRTGHDEFLAEVHDHRPNVLAFEAPEPAIENPTLASSLASLSEQEREVVERRFGLTSAGAAESAEEIAQRTGMCVMKSAKIIALSGSIALTAPIACCTNGLLR